MRACKLQTSLIHSSILAAAVLACHTGFASAETPAASTKPATNPTTKPTPSATTLPTTKAAFPTPAEVYAKMQKKSLEIKSKNQVAVFDFSEAISEAPASFSLFGGSSATFRDLTNRLRAARSDADLRGVLITLGTGSSLNVSQMQEVRRELDAMRRAGKRVFIYADSFELRDYFLASAATDVCMMPGGDSVMIGIGIETMFYKGMFEKVGLQADYVQVGEFKGAEEPYVRTQPSEELKGELDKLTKGLYDEMVNSISASRSLSAEKVRQAIDQAMLSATEMKERGLVDHLVDIDGLRDLMAEELGGAVNLKPNYGKPEAKELDFSNIFSVLATLNKKEPEVTGDKIAVIYASGTIVDGAGGGGGGIPFISDSGPSIGSEDIRKAMRMAGRDDDVKAIVIRIDSPGGSALASEAMWQAVRRVADDKPVVISIGSMAASGGYYLASSGETIWAEPSAIIGSIGVVGGKFVLSGVYEKLGLTTATFTQGRNADLFSSNKPFDERQKRMVRSMMKSTYDQFTDRIMTTRTGKIKDIDQVARGRIFVARQGLELGMVDHLGGLDDALRDAAKRANLAEGDYTVVPLPAPKTFADLMAEGSGFGASSPVSGASSFDPLTIFLKAMPESSGHLIAHQLRLAALMNKRPVVLMTPFVVSYR